MTVVADAQTVRPDDAVHILVAHDRNRRLLADVLADRYDVTADPTPPSSCDLCIVDATALERHRDALESRKAEADPAFLPCVLLVDDDRRGRVSDAVWEVVDELLYAPLDGTELTNRLDNLLERRRLSLDLAHRMERSTERFSALFRAAPDPILVADPDGEITAVNDAFVDTFDTDRDAVVGANAAALETASGESLAAILGDDAKTATVEWEVDGDRLVTELNTDRVFAADSPSDRIAVFHDVTEREERAETLHRQNERLKEFASRIAHDLRNPLSIASGHLELADSSDDHVETVRTAHDRMERLLDELLTLARDGQVVLEPEVVSLADVAETAWQHTDTGDATLSVNTDAVVRADGGRLGELLTNLFRNSVQHSSTNSHSQARGDSVEHSSTERAVHVTVGELDDGFYVADDGPGIPESDRDEAFEAGYTTSEGGTGFGLSIVRQIVDGHGWSVSITESADGGARFEFRGVEFEN